MFIIAIRYQVLDRGSQGGKGIRPVSALDTECWLFDANQQPIFPEAFRNAARKGVQFELRNITAGYNA